MKLRDFTSICKFIDKFKFLDNNKTFSRYSIAQNNISGSPKGNSSILNI